MAFTLNIDTKNAAFTDGGIYEIARLIRETADRLEDGHTTGYLRDYNGNHVGYWEHASESTHTEAV